MNPQAKAFCERVTVAGDHPTKFATYELTRQIIQQGIEGDFVEAGVLAGGHPAVMFYAMRELGHRDRKIHLFDSFDGIPQATHEDTEHSQGIYGLRKHGEAMASSGVSRCTVENVKHFFTEWGVDRGPYVFHPGWFQDTMPKECEAIEKIAILRIDVDLSESSRICYESLYHKVVKGGIIIDDDWGVPEGDPPACRLAAIKVLGFEPKVTAVEGERTTCWWVKT